MESTHQTTAASNRSSHQQRKMYCIPERFRKTENLHIVFWLIKDISWAMLWKPIGLAMLVPTLTVAIVITWQTRNIKAELFHNLAVTFWICANGYWMIVEFLDRDSELRKYTMIPFSIGLLFILTYYLYILPKERRMAHATENGSVTAILQEDHAGYKQ